ncbi:hypothetical protein G6L37_11805 [Agrobacterium rubi]|uniref:hypothetical protein n=1 Tax=Agrobacterium rubi TaxID=28099 RepID=UPI0015745DEF|nr:hypothetical protein [Agrobacterium rubi]NTF06846.1 hypothetical protein [Agrobacterium rubi]NTF19088.1 hypothetical protein [Agrobacterium rubi]NTF26051.1 hypothetical protein [Agrobacterium rubi]
MGKIHALLSAHPKQFQIIDLPPDNIVIGAGRFILISVETMSALNSALEDVSEVCGALRGSIGSPSFSGKSYSVVYKSNRDRKHLGLAIVHPIDDDEAEQIRLDPAFVHQTHSVLNGVFLTPKSSMTKISEDSHFVEFDAHGTKYRTPKTVFNSML